ncbi:enolase C-terminal domain-like protein [Parapedobacter lycopersici]|uniref:enolase C-terminal domain-like protein n=1 Tax=Parapedobacter lycopersici TaxID=1864939 RepID=UPI00214D3439|nr:enolase C-terminal domain-like protein [Parapedobacter lycopersici]
MESKAKQTLSNRREMLKLLGLGSAAGAFGLMGMGEARGMDRLTPQYARGAAPVTITRVRAITTAPGGANLVIVKVETSEPGLYGLGCATFTQRAAVVVPAIDIYLNEFCQGRDVDNIEDMWQAAYVSSYWRNGPVLNNALSGLDQALWDIKGKRLGVPVYQLLGGKTRFAIDTYAHASGRDIEEVCDNVAGYVERGFRHVRIQLGAYGGVGLDKDYVPDFRAAGYGKEGDEYMDQRSYLETVPKMFEAVRKRFGEKLELCHDVHERVEPMDAINMIKRLEEYRPFFIEDPFSPENMGWFRQLRASTTVPLAMGELFNNINEFRDYMKDQLFDYIRIHISQIGGITPAMKVARLGEWFNVKTAWHGPGDTSPVGHAANNAINAAVWNFGIQESQFFNERVHEVLPGTPVIENGYFQLSDKPGLGVDINEKEAAKYPIGTRSRWTIRKGDGTIIRP